MIQEVRVNKDILRRLQQEHWGHQECDMQGEEEKEFVWDQCNLRKELLCIAMVITAHKM